MILLLLILIAMPWPGVGWAITLGDVETGTEDGADNAFSMAAQNLTAGALNIVCVKWEGAVTLTSLTDTASNTYTLLTNQTHSLTEPSARCGYVLSASANAANVVTANFSGSASFKRGTVYGFTFSGTAVFDVEAGSIEDDADTTPSSNTVTTTGTEEVCVAIQADYQGHTFSGHTINSQVADGTSDLGDTSTWYEIFSTTFTGGASSVTRSGTARWVQRISCFKVTAGGGGSPTLKSLMLMQVGQ